MNKKVVNYMNKNSPISFYICFYRFVIFIVVATYLRTSKVSIHHNNSSDF